MCSVHAFYLKQIGSKTARKVLTTLQLFMIALSLFSFKCFSQYYIVASEDIKGLTNDKIQLLPPMLNKYALFIMQNTRLLTTSYLFIQVLLHNVKTLNILHVVT